MSNIPISSLPVAAAISGDEMVPIVQGGTTKRATTGAISEFPGTVGTFITVTAQGSAFTASRQLAVTSPLTLTDNGSGSTIVVGLGGSIGTALALSVIGNSTDAAAVPGSIAGVTNQILRVASTGTSMGFGALNLSAGGTSVSGILGVPWGGTGVTSLTLYGIPYGNGTSAIQVTGAAANSVLQTNGSSVPSLSQVLPLAVQSNITTVGTIVSGVWNGTTVSVPYGGTGATSITANGIVYGNGTSAIGVTSAAANSVLVTNGSSTPSLSQTLPLAVQQNITTFGGVIDVPHGGTGTSTLTSHGVLIGQGASTVQVTAEMSNGQLLVGQTGANPSPTTVVGDISLSAGGTATIANNAVTYAKFQQVTGLSIVGVTGTSTANTAAIAGTANQALRVNSAGTALEFGAVNLASSAGVTGNLPVTNLNSGTNASSVTFWRGDGTWATPAGGGTVTSVAAGTGLATISGLPITSTGTMTLSAARLTLPTIQAFTSGTATYNTPSNCLWIKVRMVGGGGGGGGSGSSGNGSGGPGATTTFGSLTAGGGGGGNTATNDGDAGGSASGGDINITGVQGGGAFGATTGKGGAGGGTPFGQGANAGIATSSAIAGHAGVANTGAGGAGGSSGSSGISGPGGSGGGYVEKIINSPSASYDYGVGVGGTAGSAGTAGAAGGAGGSGYIYVEEHYGS